MFENNEYIIESTPIRTKEYDNLEDVIKHLNNGIKDGLTEEEIKTILNWTVENTRKNLEQYLGINIDNFSLFGLCGLGQSSTLIPLEKYFKVTYNNTIDLPYITEDIKHAFGTITFPLKTKNGIKEKQYLIDTTLRQFYTKTMCENLKYETDQNNNLIYYAHPGYFICSENYKTTENLKFAKELLKKGYIELTDDNLKRYINSFIYSSVCYNYPTQISNIKNIPIEVYKTCLKKGKPFELEYDEEKLIKNNCNIKIKRIQKQR